MNVVILWHMHQPYYVNPLTKKAMMPWVRLHAAKGYLDMIDLVTAQPELRVNFNFTPVLVRQILELVNREVEDEWETSAASRPPTSTTRNAAISSRIFSRSTGTRSSARFPATPNCSPSAAPTTPSSKLDSIVRTFSEADFRDLQTLYNLQWCGFSAARRFPVLQGTQGQGPRLHRAGKKHRPRHPPANPRPRASANIAPRPNGARSS
jgi:alpha-amylase/alpha-mannosidase (GH57 family)